MPNNTDISSGLIDEMIKERQGSDLYILPVLGIGEQSMSYLYRSMPLSEAKNWFTQGWLPAESGIPWSTDYEYSRSKYLKNGSTVQLEVPAHDILTRIQEVGAVPKYETGQTWGVGPKAEIGRKASKEANKALVLLYEEMSDRLPQDLQNLTKNKITGTANDKKVQNALFAALFKDKVGQGRVVARRFS